MLADPDLDLRGGGGGAEGRGSYPAGSSSFCIFFLPTITGPQPPRDPGSVSDAPINVKLLGGGGGGGGRA